MLYGVVVVVVGKWTRQTQVQILDEAACISYRERFESNYSPSNSEQIVGLIGLFNLGMVATLGEGKLWIQAS